MSDSRRYRQPTGERIGRPETHRPIHDTRDDLTPLPGDMQGSIAYRYAERTSTRLEAKVSDVRSLLEGHQAETSRRIAAVAGEAKQTSLLVGQLIEARKEDRIHLRWLITTIAGACLAAIVASFTSCIHQREDIAQIKAKLDHISGGK